MNAIEPTPDDDRNDDNVVPYQAPRRGGKRDTHLTVAAVTGLNLGDLGTAEVLEIAQINVDPDYQRDLRHDLINKIARNYDIVKAGPILVSERDDGSLWAVDGQHRMGGAEQSGETEIFAHVVHGLSQADEAELRLARNDRKSDTAQEKFRSRLTMGDPVAHAITKVVEEAGTHINTTTPNSHSGINAIATLEQLYQLDYSGRWLKRVLDLIGDAFQTVDDHGEIKREMNGETCSTSMLKSVCWFLGQHVDTKECTRVDYLARLETMGYDDIKRKAITHQAALGGSLWVNFYRGMVEAYNWRRTDAKKLGWKTVGGLSVLGDQGSRKADWNAARDKMAQRRSGNR